jgi:hypothetical protein
MVINKLDPIFQTRNCYCLMTNGDKQMLMKMLREGYREMTSQFAPSETISTVQTQRPAANASSFVKTGTKTRRHGRLRGLNRGLTHRSSGWTVRTW